MACVRFRTFCVCFLFIVWVFWILLSRYQHGKSKSSQRTTKAKYTLHVSNDTAYAGFDVHKAKLHFLPNFKTPCWVQNYTGKAVYLNNSFIKKKQYPFHRQLGNRMLKFNEDGVSISLASGTCQAPARCRLRCLPYFMVIGVAKSGTSDLNSRIKQHPEIYGATAKEVYWWNQLRFSLVGATLGDYADLFDGSVRKLTETNKQTLGSQPHVKHYYKSIIGEYTSMTFFDFAHWRKDPRNKNLLEPKYTLADDIRAVIPDVKLIVTMRNPTTRLYSSYNMFIPVVLRSPADFHNRVSGSIAWWNECVKILPERNCAFGSPPGLPPVYDLLGNREQWWRIDRNYTGEIRHGMYGLIVSDWLNNFPRENLLFLRMEDYSKNINEMLNNVVFPFLKVQNVTDKRIFKKLNRKSIAGHRTYLPMLNETKVLLDKFYEPFNRRLAKLLLDDKWLWSDTFVPVRKSNFKLDNRPGK